MNSIKLALLGFMTISVVACSDGQLSSTMPMGPSGIGSSALNATTSDGGAFSTLDDSRLPAIVVRDGISCPSDAPLLLVGSVGTRIDAEWSPIPRVQGYQVSIEMRNEAGEWGVVNTMQTTRVRAEYYGSIGRQYRVRVRSQVCNTFGNWSAYQTQSIDDPYTPPPAIIEEECIEPSAVPNGRVKASMVPDCMPECDFDEYRTTSYNDDCEPECDEYNWQAGRISKLGECWWDERVTLKRR